MKDVDTMSNIEQIKLHLKAPGVILERLESGRHVPKVFAKVAAGELRQALHLLRKLKMGR